MKRPPFEASTDMAWKTFKDKVYARIDAVDVCLNYRIYANCSTWLDLNCEADLTVRMACVKKKALVARTRVVTMEIKNAVSDGRFLTKKCLPCLQLQKLRGREGRKEKRSRENDIPARPSPIMKRQLEYVCDIQARKHCAEHSKPGRKVYCHIQLAKEGVEGGHLEMNHADITLWAKHIVSIKAYGSATMTY